MLGQTYPGLKTGYQKGNKPKAAGITTETVGAGQNPGRIRKYRIAAATTTMSAGLLRFSEFCVDVKTSLFDCETC